MDLLIIGCVTFVVFHLGISGTPLRKVLQDALGVSPYLGLYSVLSIGTFGLMIYGYGQAPHNDFLWVPSALAYKINKVITLIAFVTVVTGLLTPNPTAVLSDAALDNDVSGMLKITRHPVQWAILLFAIGHLIANGDVASVILFGSLALLSFFGMLSMDGRKRAQADPRWKTFMETTSMVPFVEMLSGKTRLTLADINWVAMVIGVVVYAAFYWGHEWVSGVAL